MNSRLLLNTIQFAERIVGDLFRRLDSRGEIKAVPRNSFCDCLVLIVYFATKLN